MNHLGKGRMRMRDANEVDKGRFPERELHASTTEVGGG